MDPVERQFEFPNSGSSSTYNRGPVKTKASPFATRGLGVVIRGKREGSTQEELSVVMSKSLTW